MGGVGVTAASAIGLGEALDLSSKGAFALASAALAGDRDEVRTALEWAIRLARVVDDQRHCDHIIRRTLQTTSTYLRTIARTHDDAIAAVALIRTIAQEIEDANR